MLIVYLGRRTVHAQAFMNEGCQGSDVYKIISPCLFCPFKIESCPYGIHLVVSKPIVLYHMAGL